MNLRQAVPKQKQGNDAEATTTTEMQFEQVRMLCPRIPKAVASHSARTAIEVTTNTLFQIMVAITVGAALIAPMLIMVLHSSRNVSLITTCVFVFLFASGLAILNPLVYWAGGRLPLGIKSDLLGGSMLELKDIVGATAAYAAVLVVFVGVSSPG